MKKVMHDLKSKGNKTERIKRAGQKSKKLKRAENIEQAR